MGLIRFTLRFVLEAFEVDSATLSRDSLKSTPTHMPAHCCYWN